MSSTLAKVRLGFRILVSSLWILAILGVWFAPRTWPKPWVMGFWWIFRVTAILGLVYLLYEVNEASERRIRVAGVLFDSLLVVPMFLFWFAVSAATF